MRGHLRRGCVVPAPVETAKKDPRITSIAISIGKAERFLPLRKESEPGPGHYGQFTINKGLPYRLAEEVVLGPNHSFQWKVSIFEYPKAPFFYLFGL